MTAMERGAPAAALVLTIALAIIWAIVIPLNMIFGSVDWVKELNSTAAIMTLGFGSLIIFFIMAGRRPILLWKRRHLRSVRKRLRAMNPNGPVAKRISNVLFVVVFVTSAACAIVAARLLGDAGVWVPIPQLVGIGVFGTVMLATCFGVLWVNNRYFPREWQEGHISNQK